MFVSFFLALLLVSSDWTLPSVPERQGLQAKLQTKLENYTVIADNFPQALTKIAAEFEIPMGIEWVRTPATLRKVERTWQGSTVHQVIASLVTSQPGYDFRVRNGVAHVSYRGALTDNSSFLNKRIDKFEARNEFVGVVSYRLRELLKPIVAIPIPGEPGVGMAGSMATGAGDQQVSFRLLNATVREILDTLSLAADFKIWIVTYPEDCTLTGNGFRRVESLYSRNPVPDNEQPVWAFLRWGDAVPRSRSISHSPLPLGWGSAAPPHSRNHFNVFL